MTLPRTPELSTLSLHDALPICEERRDDAARRAAGAEHEDIGSVELHAVVARQVGDEARAVRVVGVDPRVAPHEEIRGARRSEEHTSELQSRENLVCRLLLEKKK